MRRITEQIRDGVRTMVRLQTFRSVARQLLLWFVNVDVILNGPCVRVACQVYSIIIYTLLYLFVYCCVS